MSTRVSSEMAEQPLFIVNPASGGGRTKHRVGALIDAIERAGMAANIAFTERRGHGQGIASEAIERGHRFLVACGGDGTVNEVANAILDARAGDDVRVGTVAMGTGKDIAKCLGMARGSRAIAAIVAGHERRIDAGRVEAKDELGADLTRYFVLEASAGWVPGISQSTPRWLKRLGDTAPYLIVGAVKMAGPLGRSFTLTIDGTSYDGRYNTISVHNMELWGGDLVAAPGALPDDGLLDAIRWGDLNRAHAVKAMLGQRAGGTHLRMNGIDHQRARHIELSSPKRTMLDLDGEFGGYLPATVEVLPAALRFVAPPVASAVRPEPVEG